MQQQDKKWWAHAKLAPKSPWDFVLCCKTRDEHDSIAGPKPFPELAMYRIFVRVWLEQNIFFVEKSRQHMFTWIMVILLLWDSIHHKGRRNIIGSTHQIRADKVTQRAKVIITNLEKDNYPHLPKVRKVAGAIGTSNRIEFTTKNKQGWDSIIESVPQGSDAVISETISNFFDDETHYQPDAEVRYELALPAILGETKDKSGRYITGGSPNGKWTFAYRQQYAIDKLTGKSLGDNKVDSRRLKSALNIPEYHDDGREYTQEEQRLWIEKKLVTMPDDEFNAIPIEQLVASCPGLWYWITCNDVVVFGMHYRANPYHDPVTKAGKEWYELRRPKYDKSGWARQMEISYDVTDGQPVVDIFADNHATFVRPIEYDKSITLDLTWDPGTNGSSCLFSQKRKIPGFNAYQTVFIGEVFMMGENTATLVTEVLSYMEKYFTYAYEHLNDTRSVCDQAGNQNRDSASDKNLKSTFDILRAAGFRVIGSKKIGITAGVERVQTIFAKVHPAGNPPTAVVVHPRCELLIQTLSTGWRFPEWTNQRTRIKAANGHPVKDGYFEHIGDCVRYRINHDHPDGQAVLNARPDSEKRPIPQYCPITGVLLGYKKRQQTRGRTHAIYSA